MSERELTDEEITAWFEKFAGLMRDLTDVLEKMAANMELVVSTLRTLAAMQGVDKKEETWPGE